MSSAPQSLNDSALGLSQPTHRGAQNPAWVLTACSVSGSLVFVGSSVITVALAAIGRDLNLSPSELQWLINAELLPLAAFTLIAGAMGDKFGQKRMLLLGIALYGLGVGGAALANSWLMLITARFLQGIGESLILPNSLSLLGQAFPSESKARAVGVWSAAAAVASAMGPAIAGEILADGTWRSVFLMLAPLVVIAFILNGLWIPNRAPTVARSIDVAGGIYSSLALGSIGFVLTRLTSDAALSIRDYVVLGAGVTSLVALVTTERRRGDAAMIPLALLRSRSVIGANIYTALLYGPFAVMLTLIPFVMIRGVHLSAVLAGVAFLPLQASITVLSPWAGALCRRFGRRPPLIAGACIVAMACVAALRIGERASYWMDILPAITLLALGMGLAIAPLTTLVLTSVEPARAGTAAGINGAASRAGSLLATAMLGTVLRESGTKLVAELHTAMIVSAIACVAAACAVLIIEPGPHVDFVPID